jgi:class 3 adenylate cyclase
MLSGFGLETVLDLICRAALAYRGARHREAILGAETVSRRLAAIIAADVAGYSQLMEADDEETLARLGSLRHHRIDPNSTRGARLRPPATAC